MVVEKETYGRVSVRKGVINAHILKKPPNVGLEESLNFLKIELRIDEYCAKVGFKNVRETL